MTQLFNVTNFILFSHKLSYVNYLNWMKVQNHSFATLVTKLIMVHCTYVHMYVAIWQIYTIVPKHDQISHVLRWCLFYMLLGRAPTSKSFWSTIQLQTKTIKMKSPILVKVCDQPYAMQYKMESLTLRSLSLYVWDVNKNDKKWVPYRCIIMTRSMLWLVSNRLLTGTHVWTSYQWMKVGKNDSGVKGSCTDYVWLEKRPRKERRDYSDGVSMCVEEGLMNANTKCKPNCILSIQKAKITCPNFLLSLMHACIFRLASWCCQHLSSIVRMYILCGRIKDKKMCYIFHKVARLLYKWLTWKIQHSRLHALWVMVLGWINLGGDNLPNSKQHFTHSLDLNCIM